MHVYLIWLAAFPELKVTKFDQIFREIKKKIVVVLR